MSMANCSPSRSVPPSARGSLTLPLSSTPRVNGTLRDRLNALTRKTHAFAKRDATWDALVGLQLFDHNFHRAHQALRLPRKDGVRRYRQQSPAMALGLTDHLWSFQELLTSRIPITP